MVRDEGRTIKGIAAIKTWRSETGEKYHRTVEPLSVTERGGARSKLSVCDYDRFWHIAGVPLALTSVYFEGKNGHNADVTPFPLMTQSGQATPFLYRDS